MPPVRTAAYSPLHPRADGHQLNVNPCSVSQFTAIETRDRDTRAGQLQTLRTAGEIQLVMLGYRAKTICMRLHGIHLSWHWEHNAPRAVMAERTYFR